MSVISIFHVEPEQVALLGVLAIPLGMALGVGLLCRVIWAKTQRDKQ